MRKETKSPKRSENDKVDEVSKTSEGNGQTEGSPIHIHTYIYQYIYIYVLCIQIYIMHDI